MLAAAYLALNQRGEGSSPSGPTCTRDVTAASLLAMQDVRVRFPLGALSFLAVWPMVRQLPVKETIAGSIPAAAVAEKGKAMKQQ